MMNAGPELDGLGTRRQEGECPCRVGQRMLRPMSQVGQTQTSGRIPARSVLPPTTDMRRLRQHFRLVPISEVALSFDHLVGDQ